MPAKTHHRTRSGKILYRVDHPDFPDGIWGAEHWRMTVHEDQRVMRSYCELNDNPPLIRDAIQAVDLDFHPHDSFVRLTESNRFKGSTWYRFSDTEAEYHGYTREKGRIHEKVEISRAMRGFGAHALNSDAWLTARYDFSRGPGIQTFHNNLLTSIDHRGATGPAFERTTTSSLQYSGVESITVAAGQFDCHHFAFVNTSNHHPPYDFWVTSDGDFIYVKGRVTEPYNWSFELTEINEE